MRRKRTKLEYCNKQILHGLHIRQSRWAHLIFIKLLSAFRKATAQRLSIVDNLAREYSSMLHSDEVGL